MNNNLIKAFIVALCIIAVIIIIIFAKFIEAFIGTIAVNIISFCICFYVNSGINVIADDCRKNLIK